MQPAARRDGGGTSGGATFCIVSVASVRVELPDQYPMVTLEDAEQAGRSLTFRIGLAEGVALAQALAGTLPARPTTHELFAEAIHRYGIEVLAVRLVGRVGSTYLAELDLVGGHGRELLSCRPSDALCLALRQRVAAPILADPRLFTVAGDVLPDGGDGGDDPDGDDGGGERGGPVGTGDGHEGGPETGPETGEGAGGDPADHVGPAAPVEQGA